MTTDKLKINKDSPEGLKLSYWLWMELGRPPQFRSAKTFKAWSRVMDSLLGKSGLDYEHFKWFLVWVCRLDDLDGAKYGNDFTARYLRAATDPMACLAKNFDQVFLTFFVPKADKCIPLLKKKRDQEDAEKEARKQPEPGEQRVRYVDIACPEAMRNAADLDRLDDAFPMRQPFPGETVEDWIHREFLPFNGDWKCEHCTYAFSIEAEDDSRTKLCADCLEELVLWAQDDLEWLHDHEPAVVEMVD